MKTTFLRMIALVLTMSVATGGMAGKVDIANIPLGNSISPAVKPNIMFILDRSGSMAWTHLPDVPMGSWSTATGSAAQNKGNSLAGRYGYASAQCNPLYFDPNTIYTPPVYADGTSYPNARFRAAPPDGFSPGTCNTCVIGSCPASCIDLSKSFRAYTSTTTYDSWSDAAQAAYYYRYSGTHPYPASHFEYQLGAGGADATAYGPVTTTDYYKECASAIGNSPGKDVFTRVDVSAAAADVQQNFANWYSYYRTRILLMKTATGLALKQLNNPNSLRLGYVDHDYWTYDNGRFVAIDNFSDTSGVSNSCAAPTTQRAKLYCALYGAALNAGTPTRTALSQVGRIYANKLNGYADPVQFKCQRNSAILATDGFWNTDTKGMKMDGSAVKDQDGADVAPYRDASGVSDTMADIAMYYYKTHIRSALDNPPPPATEKAIASCPDVPKEGWVRQTAKDCATYLHMNTYTLGLGASGALNYKYGYETRGTSTDYDAIVDGTLQWPNPVDKEDIHRIDDLWHAAVNGRGLYFNATKVETLAAGLKQAFAAASESGAGGAPAVGSLALSEGGYSYIAGYKTDEWVGELGKYSIDAKTGKISPTAEWSAQAKLDAKIKADPGLLARTIFMAVGGELADFKDNGNLDTAKTKKWFSPGSDNPNGALEQYQFFTAEQIAAATQASIIDFIRGARGLEDPLNNTTSTDAKKLYRGRTHMLGDIVHSSPLYIKESNFDYLDSGYESFKTSTKGRTAMVYVGANDGMLHAFDAATGEEKWAFVPTAVLPYLYRLADKNYNVKHRYFVDGWIMAADANFGVEAADWRTVLIGGLGKGGRAYYALDITDPAKPALLWEFAATAQGTTGVTYDEDLGFTPDGAQIHKIDGTSTWVATFASGYNNTDPGDGKGRLYVLDLKSGAKLEEIVTAGGNDPLTSGIGWVQGWTMDQMKDSSVRHVYGGDLGGRVWRFDIKKDVETATLLTTLGSATLKQPVTSRAALGTFAGNTDERVIYIGTGRYLGYCDIDPSTDPDNPKVPCAGAYLPANSLQSLYAIRDTGSSPKSDVGKPYFRDVAIELATNVRTATMTYNGVTTNKNGWYLDFTASSGERVTTKPQLINNRNLVVMTNVPASDECAVGGSGWVYFLETQPASSHKAVEGTWVSLGSALGTGMTTLTGPNGQPFVVVQKSDSSTQTIPGGKPTFGNSVRRISWRELVD